MTGNTQMAVTAIPPLMGDCEACLVKSLLQTLSHFKSTWAERVCHRPTSRSAKGFLLDNRPFVMSGEHQFPESSSAPLACSLFTNTLPLQRKDCGTCLDDEAKTNGGRSDQQPISNKNERIIPMYCSAHSKNVKGVS